jgi:hypothetical protein
MNPETKADIVEQIEFRWTPDADFGPIASSSHSPQFNGDYRQLLQLMAEPPEGVVDGHRSVVYLVFPQRRSASIVERSFTNEALRLIEYDGPEGGVPEDGGRHPQVARALIGSFRTVGVDLALACAERGLTGLGIQPGQAEARQRLIRPAVSRFDAFIAEATELADKLSRTPPGLAHLIAAVLREPDKPISMLLQGDLLRRQTVQHAYLRGLRHTAWYLLEGTDTGWQPSFSTFEPASGRTAADLPHLVFREVQARGDAPPPETRSEQRIAADDAARQELSRTDRLDRIAVCLANAYYTLGRSALSDILEPLVVRNGSFEARLAAVEATENLASFLPARARTTAATPRPRPDPQADQRPVPPPAPAETLATRPRTAAHAVRQKSLSWELGPDLNRLYHELAAQRGREGFVEIVELICAFASHQVTVADEEADLIIRRIDQDHWYLTDLREHNADRAAERLSGLMYPLFAGRLDDRTSVWFQPAFTDPDEQSTWLRGMAMFYHRLIDHVAAPTVGHQLTQAVLDNAAGVRSRQDAAQVPDPSLGSALPAPGGRRESALAAWLRLDVSVPIWAGLTVAVLLFVSGVLMAYQA